MVKKIRKKRVTLAEKLATAHEDGRLLGHTQGAAEVQRTMQPNWQIQTGVNDFILMVESWPLEDSGVISLAGTDLIHHCHAALPARLIRALAGELRRLGYGKRRP